MIRHLAPALLIAVLGCAPSARPVVFYPEAVRVELQAVPPGPAIYELAAPLRLTADQRSAVDKALRVSRGSAESVCRTDETAYFFIYLAAGDRQVGQLQVCLCGKSLKATPSPAGQGERLDADFAALARVTSAIQPSDCPAP